VGPLRDRLENVVGKKISQLLLTVFVTMAACGEAARADLGAENVFV
jgi:lipoprotein